MSKLKVTTISDPDNDNTAITVDSTGAITVAQNATFSGSVTASSFSGDGSSLTGISSYADSDVLDLFNVTDSNPVYACRAWINFNGISTTSITASGGISSVTDNGTGITTINFSFAFPDTNYIHVTGSSLDSGESAAKYLSYPVGQTKTTTAILLYSEYDGSKYDQGENYAAFFR